ncbi:hypothetical protein SCOR_26180 [Sulfidibacter corallicola]
MYLNRAILGGALAQSVGLQRIAAMLDVLSEYASGMPDHARPNTFRTNILHDHIHPNRTL